MLNAPNIVKPDMMNLSDTNDGDIFWNEDRLDEAQLTQRLQAAAAKEPLPEVFIRSDRKVEYERVAKAMVAVQKAGVLKLGIVTEPYGQ